MSSSPPPPPPQPHHRLSIDATAAAAPQSPSISGAGAAAAAAAATAATGGPSPSPSTSDVPRADEVGQGEAGEGGDGAGPDLPMTMQASVILTSLPKDAKSALQGAGEIGVEKVKIRFRPVGSAPGLNQPVRKLSSTARFESVVRFLRKQLRLQDHESVFCYVNSVFAPGLDEGIGNLWRCFKSKDELVVAYSITPAFG